MGVNIFRLCLLSSVLNAAAATDAALIAKLTELEQEFQRNHAELQALAAEAQHKQKHVARRLADDTVAADTTFDDNIQGAMTHAWLILCGALVMFMQGGFAMLTAGTCRRKFVQNILLKNLTDVCIGTWGWWIFGWAFAYSGPFDDDDKLETKFIGYASFMGVHGFIERDKANPGVLTPTDNILSWFFQWAFCSAAATIVSGGVCERMKFGGYAIYSFLLTSFIYPVVVAWTWGYGFLENFNSTGYMDFAGSGIVHMTGGIGALVGAIVAGPRYNRFKPLGEDQEDEFVPHSMPLVVLGTFSLWFGWYGFNCGSTLAMGGIEDGFKAAHVAMNTTIAGAVGGIVVFILKFAFTMKVDIGAFCNGILAGLVSITAPCSTVEYGSAVAIACIGALIYLGASSLLKLIHVDDPLDAFPIHGACGAWGVLAAALFDWGRGFDHVHGWSGFRCVKNDIGECMDGAGGDLVLANLAEIGCIFAWVGILSAFIFVPLRLCGVLVASQEEQDVGFDKAEHSPSKAYDMGSGGGDSSVV